MSNTATCKISLSPVPDNQKYSGYRNAEIKKFFGSQKVSPLLDFTRSDFFTQGKAKVKGMSISGVQEKLSLKINDQHSLEATASNGTYILKPSPEAFPNAAENEHCAMKLHELMGIDTAESGLVVFKDEENAYITKRFDRISASEKIHQEDLLQCFDKPTQKKYDATYEQAGLLLNEVIGGKKTVMLEYVRRIIMAYLIGNDDFHLKNISVQRLPNNKGQHYDGLTPSYDNLFVEAFTEHETGSQFLALGLLHDSNDDNSDDNDEDHSEYHTEAYQHYGYYTGYDFLILADRLDVTRKSVISFINKLKKNERKIKKLIDDSYMPEKMKDRAKEIVTSRMQAIQHVEFSSAE